MGDYNKYLIEKRAYSKVFHWEQIVEEIGCTLEKKNNNNNNSRKAYDMCDGE